MCFTSVSATFVLNNSKCVKQESFQHWIELVQELLKSFNQSIAMSVTLTCADTLTVEFGPIF